MVDGWMRWASKCGQCRNPRDQKLLDGQHWCCVRGDNVHFPHRKCRNYENDGTSKLSGVPDVFPGETISRNGQKSVGQLIKGYYSRSPNFCPPSCQYSPTIGLLLLSTNCACRSLDMQRFVNGFDKSIVRLYHKART